jgi:hypothetical protein
MTLVKPTGCDHARSRPPATIGPMEIMGVEIRKIIQDNVPKRCAGCG